MGETVNLLDTDIKGKMFDNVCLLNYNFYIAN